MLDLHHSNITFSLLIHFRVLSDHIVGIIDSVALNNQLVSSETVGACYVDPAFSHSERVRLRHAVISVHHSEVPITFG